ncbi:MAG: PilN domain-containing protein [Candidatus Acidiferrales bacterium]
MIRINLLGRVRPKAARQTVPLESTLQVILLVAALAISVGVLWYYWAQLDGETHTLQADIQKQQGEKARLENLKTQVENFQREKDVLQQRIDVIEQLQRNRTGGQELMDALANTVVRTDTLWLTSVGRKGDSLAITGEAASINAVANFITELKRSGYFDQIEIKESHQDPSEKVVQTFVFELTAQFALPEARNVAAPAAASASPAPMAAPPAGHPAVKE